MLQENGVHGIAQGVEASEGEGEIAQASGEGDALAGALNLFHGVEEVNAVGLVLRQTRGDGQHVAVPRREVQVLPQDADIVLERGCLALLVEGHDHHRRAVAQRSLACRRNSSSTTSIAWAYTWHQPAFMSQRFICAAPRAQLMPTVKGWACFKLTYRVSMV